MFDPTTPTGSEKLRTAIDTVFAEMTNHSSDSDEYRKMAERLKELYALQKMEQEFELKKLEALTKDQQIENDRALKEEELKIKRDELNHEIARSEKEMRLKLEEFALREAEVETNRDLTDADIRLKNLEADEMQKNSARRWKVSHDTLAIVAGNLLGIAVIVGYERANVVTTKALSFLRQPR